MIRKFWVGLLILTFMLGSLNIFWSKPAQANNTEEKRRECVCAAWPWDNDFPGANNPSPPDTSGLGTAQSQIKLQNAQQSSASNKTDSRARNLFHHILHTLWGVIFPEPF